MGWPYAHRKGALVLQDFRGRFAAGLFLSSPLIETVSLDESRNEMMGLQRHSSARLAFARHHERKSGMIVQGFSPPFLLQ
jgi:hypothetical protein